MKAIVAIVLSIAASFLATAIVVLATRTVAHRTARLATAEPETFPNLSAGAP